MVMDFERRLKLLEDDRAIRDLKARYLRAADSKDVEGIRGCFVPDAIIDFEGFPRFEARDPFVAIYQQMACVPGIFDIHHGANGIIKFDDDENASGQWSLLFHNINLEARTLTQMGVEYEDAYVKGSDGSWRIAETRSRRTSALVHSVADNGQPSVIVMGAMTTDFGS
jgi:ketosteroid isomerase-like protein